MGTSPFLVGLTLSFFFVGVWAHIRNGRVYSLLFVEGRLVVHIRVEEGVEGTTRLAAASSSSSPPPYLFRAAFMSESDPPSPPRKGTERAFCGELFLWPGMLLFSHPPPFHVVAEKRGKEAFSFPFLVPFYSPPFSLCRFMVVGFLCRSPSPPTEMRLGIRETRKGRGGMEGAEDQSG